MKKLLLLVVALVVSSSMQANAWNLKDALNGLSGKGGGSSSESSALSDLGSVLNNLLASSDITIEQLQGVWGYTAPAVAFESNDILKKAGGAAASSMIEEKLAPIYKRTGFDKLQLTINSDSSFVFKTGKITLKGIISSVPKNTDVTANFIFNFTIGGQYSIGAMDAYVTMSASDSMCLTFDVTRLVNLMETVSNVTNNSTLKSTVELLKSYDGLSAGFELKRKGDAPKVQ